MKRILVIVLCAILLLGMLPMEAQAAQKPGRKLPPKPTLHLSGDVKSNLNKSRALDLGDYSWDYSGYGDMGGTIYWQIYGVEGDGALQYKFDVYLNGDLHIKDSSWGDSNYFEMEATEVGWYRVIVLVKDSSDGDVDYILGPETYVDWPTYLTLNTPKITSVTAISGTSLKITWNKVPGADEYLVFRKIDENSWYGWWTTATSYTNTGLKAGTRYYYEVMAWAFKGDHYEVSEDSATRTGVPLDKSTIRSVVSAGSGKLKITWAKVTGASGYKILRSTTPGGVYKQITTTTKLTYTNAGLVKGKTYYYKIQPYKRISTTSYVGPIGGYKGAKVK